MPARAPDIRCHGSGSRHGRPGGGSGAQTVDPRRDLRDRALGALRCGGVPRGRRAADRADWALARLPGLCEAMGKHRNWDCATDPPSAAPLERPGRSRSLSSAVAAAEVSHGLLARRCMFACTLHRRRTFHAPDDRDEARHRASSWPGGRTRARQVYPRAESSDASASGTGNAGAAASRPGAPRHTPRERPAWSMKGVSAGYPFTYVKEQMRHHSIKVTARPYGRTGLTYRRVAWVVPG
jgi:hypothetical protein